MNRTEHWFYGIDALLNHHLDWLEGCRVTLIGHPASVDCNGVHSAVRLRECEAVNLVALMGPEHGFDGIAGPGESVVDGMHPLWGIPVYSLYGSSRAPTGKMMEETDVIIFDLQNIGVRCYTYSSTLKLVLEAAQKFNKRVIVCDRPDPLHGVVDGPMLDVDYVSFVGSIMTRFCYGLSTGELAAFLKVKNSYQVDLKIAMSSHVLFDHAERWIPSSPGIPELTTARIYPGLVFFEALPMIDYGRGTEHIFQRFGAPDLPVAELCETLPESFPEYRFEPIEYIARHGELDQCACKGVHITIPVPHVVLHPAALAVHITYVLQRYYGSALWSYSGSRPAFFDKLWGTGIIRERLMQGDQPQAICRDF